MRLPALDRISSAAYGKPVDGDIAVDYRVSYMTDDGEVEVGTTANLLTARDYAAECRADRRDGVRLVPVFYDPSTGVVLDTMDGLRRLGLAS